MTLMTNALIEAGKSRNGGWSKDQFAALGIDWPPRSGWKKRLIGQWVENRAVGEFLALRDEHISKAKVIL